MSAVLSSVDLGQAAAVTGGEGQGDERGVAPVAQAVSGLAGTEGIDEGAQGLAAFSDEKVRDWPSSILNQDMFSHM
jgi:hypothetical protein